MAVSFVRCANIPFEKVGGDLVVVDSKNEYFFSSNSVGAFIWDSLEFPSTKDDLCNAILKQFNGAGASEVEKDLDEFIESLLANSLIAKLEN